MDIDNRIHDERIRTPHIAAGARVHEQQVVPGSKQTPERIDAQQQSASGKNVSVDSKFFLREPGLMPKEYFF